MGTHESAIALGQCPSLLEIIEANILRTTPLFLNVPRIDSRMELLPAIVPDCATIGYNADYELQLIGAEEKALSDS